MTGFVRACSAGATIGEPSTTGSSARGVPGQIDPAQMSLLRNLAQMERTREAYWLCYLQTSPTRLQWRARAARHILHITSRDSVLEIGAGSGLWTERLTAELRDGATLTAAVFNADLAAKAESKSLHNTKVVQVQREEDLPTEGYDYVLGTAILSHDRYEENLAWLRSLVKPGGRILFFEANFTNPQVFAKARSKRLARWAGNAPCQIALRKPALREAAQLQGFTDVEIVPFDILHPRTPARLIPSIQSTAFLVEHMPGIRNLCGTSLISAHRAGPSSSSGAPIDLTRHQMFNQSVSVVVPCHNEAMNIPGLVGALIAMYGNYLREIVVVNDNSEDGTAEVVAALAEKDSRIRLLNRTPPPGVGRALRDGYAATSGEWILTMDCDFEALVPELSDLFEPVATGHDGAIGSRFSHQSVLVNYPAGKLLGNRAFHLLVRLVLRRRVHDISNNLKLYRGDILRHLEITQDGFAANAETGLKPLLEGWDIKEVPVSWINRDEDMGTSAFRLIKVAPGYLVALVRMLIEYGWKRGSRSRGQSAPASASTPASPPSNRREEAPSQSE